MVGFQIKALVLALARATLVCGQWRRTTKNLGVAVHF